MRVASFESPRATTRAPQGAIDIPTCAAQPFPIQNYCLTEIVKDGKGRPIMANHGVITKDHHDAYYNECKMPAIDDALRHATAPSEPLGTVGNNRCLGSKESHGLHLQGG